MECREGGQSDPGLQQHGHPSGTFSGGGYTLGSDEVPSNYVGDPQQPEAGDGEEETAIRTITFWRNGFSVEDGELLQYDNPENARLLQDINSG